MNVHLPAVIQDARKDKTSKHAIQEQIVQGVLHQTGLPSLSNVVTGPSKMKESGQHSAVAPAHNVPATPQHLGSARYMASQDRKGRK